MLGEVMSLDKLHPHHWHYLLKFLRLVDKKNLKLVNMAIYSTVTEVDKSLKCAYKKSPITPAQLIQLADDCPALIGLECTLHKDELEGLAEAMDYLHKKHPAIEKVNISLDDNHYSSSALEHISNGCPILTGLKVENKPQPDGLNETVAAIVRRHPELQSLKFSNSHFSDGGLSSLLQLKHLKVLHLISTLITGANVCLSQDRETVLPCLEELILRNGFITDSDIINILCGDKLKELDLSNTNISGKGIAASCQNLQKLYLRWCKNLTNHSLDNLLTLWGGTLTKLDLTYTNISGEDISVSCPQLQKLCLPGCVLTRCSDCGEVH